MKNRPFCLFPAFPASESASLAGYRHYKLLDLRIIIIKNFLFNTVLPLLLAKKIVHERVLVLILQPPFSD